MAWSLDEIFKEVKEMEGNQKQLKQDLMKICWYMRGGLTYEEAMYTSFEEREIISKIIKENLETTKKSGLPFF